MKTESLDASDATAYSKYNNNNDVKISDKAPESDTVMTMESEENAPKESITVHQDDKGLKLE